MLIWLVVSPGYGDFTGLPERAFATYEEARGCADEMNEPWAYTMSREWRLRDAVRNDNGRVVSHYRLSCRPFKVKAFRMSTWSAT